VIVSVPARVPVAVGVKVTEILQLIPAAMVGPQVFVCEKSPLVPILFNKRSADPVLVNATVCATLVV